MDPPWHLNAMHDGICEAVFCSVLHFNLSPVTCAHPFSKPSGEPAMYYTAETSTLKKQKNKKKILSCKILSRKKCINKLSGIWGRKKEKWSQWDESAADRDREGGVCVGRGGGGLEKFVKTSKQIRRKKEKQADDGGKRKKRVGKIELAWFILWGVKPHK